MIDCTRMLLLDVVVIVLMGAMAGVLGSLLGLGGGVFLVPFLVIVQGLPFRQAAGISLMTVIATSSAVSARSAGHNLINLRLGMVLEIATTAGGLAGGITALAMPQRALSALFGFVMVAVAGVMAMRLDRRNIIVDVQADPGRLGGRIHDPESGREVVYRVKRLPVAMFASFLAGNVSGLLGIGGGVLKVPALNTWCGVPMRAAAATSAMMIGVTAVATAPIYYAHGEIVPHLAAAAVLGVLGGSRAGSRLAMRFRARRLKTLMIAVLITVAALMFTRAW
jgi:uncharacterized membrane protein YfcA